MNEQLQEGAEGHELELREEESGLRHYLAGEPVHCGMGLELRVWRGPAVGWAWQGGRYEAWRELCQGRSWRGECKKTSECPGHLVAYLFVTLGQAASLTREQEDRGDIVWTYQARLELHGDEKVRPARRWSR